MDYIRQAIAILPVAAFVAFIIYMPVFFFIRKKHQVAGWNRHLLNYIFCGYCVTVVFITLVWSNIPRMHGYSINLKPFQALYGVIIYGNINLLIQYILNILMFVPFGLILPAVFPKVLKGRAKKIFVFLVVPILIEVMQYFLGRAVDIDDVIANTLGGLSGYSLLILIRWLFCRKPTKLSVKLASFAVLAVTILIPLSTMIINESREFGVVAPNYMSLPGELKEIPELDDSEGFYMAYKQISVDRTSTIKSVYGLDNQAVLSTSKYSYSDDDKYVTVYEDNSWSIDLDRRYFADGPKNIIAPDDDRCIQVALQAIAPFTNDWETIESIDVQENKVGYGEAGTGGSTGKVVEYIYGKLVRLSAVSKESKLRIFGDVIVKIGENGTVNSIDDNRRYFEPLREVSIISPRAAVDKAKRGGFEHELTDMILDSIELEYQFDRVKGHLLPVYKLSGTAKKADGSEEEWSTFVSAMKTSW